ncbi:MAG: hypothetical protein N3F64_06360 [Nitrososphaeria archaeon]|nr:hypothetical protein [Nitrososphaeria archaeon]
MQKSFSKNIHSIKFLVSNKVYFTIIILAITIIILFSPIIPITYTTKVPHEYIEQYYEEVPVKVIRRTEWNVTWYAVTGDFKFITEIGKSKFPACFSYDWGYSRNIFNGEEFVGFMATAIIKVRERHPIWINLTGDDGCELYLNGSRFLCTSFYSGYKTEFARVTLEPGVYLLTLYYYNSRGGYACVSFSADSEVLEWTDLEYRRQLVQRTVTEYEYENVTSTINILSYLLGYRP